MSLSVLSDVEDDHFWRKRPLRKINFKPKKKRKTSQQNSRLSEKKKRGVPLPLSIINSIVADKGLCKYPRGMSAVSRYCHRYLHQSIYQFSEETKNIFKKKGKKNTNLDVNISSMKRLIELFCKAFPRLPQIHRERYLPTTTSFNVIVENNQTLSNGATSVVPGGILPEDLTWIVFFL